MEPLPLLLVLLAGTLATDIIDKPLDMAPNSFDDQYRGCQDRMLRVLPKLNRTEFATNRNYSKTWVTATALWNKRPHPHPLLPRDEGISLLAYTLWTNLYLTFNAATREAGSSSCQYRNNFHYKVLHFLLTRALEDLQRAESHPRCFHVYRGVRGTRFITRPGRTVRLGQFTSSSPKKEVAQRFGTDTFFEVETCHGASIRNFSNVCLEEEVLIPPFEKFKVTRVTHLGGKTQIQLKSHGVYSKYNCEYLRG
ncbi:NRT2 ribosyltransferase, partial [Calyptomena viridis]|nr:NRT2 ribosyltransferase [Calyptomena viridis]